MSHFSKGLGVYIPHRSFLLCGFPLSYQVFFYLFSASQHSCLHHLGCHSNFQRHLGASCLNSTETYIVTHFMYYHTGSDARYLGYLVFVRFTIG